MHGEAVKHELTAQLLLARGVTCLQEDNLKLAIKQQRACEERLAAINAKLDRVLYRMRQLEERAIA